MRFITLDIEAVIADWWSPPEDKPDQFAPIPAWIPVEIGMLLAVTCGTEIGTFEYFSGQILKAQSFDFMARTDRLITFNGRGFDVPVLRLSAARLGISVPWLTDDKLARYDNYKRNKWHWDLLDLMTGTGAAQRFSLDSLCKSFGLPGKGDIEGSDVAALYRANRHDLISRYCAEDVLQTWLCACKWMAHADGIPDLTAPTLERAADIPIFGELLSTLRGGKDLTPSSAGASVEISGGSNTPEPS